MVTKQTGQHTPGPWRFEDFYGANVNQRPIKAVVGAPGNGRLIHAVADFLIDEESVANARLIAAAPELLEALEAISASFDNGTDPKYDGSLDNARAAIEKARGA